MYSDDARLTCTRVDIGLLWIEKTKKSVEKIAKNFDPKLTRLQGIHLKLRIPWWTFMCASRPAFCLNNLPQISHSRSGSLCVSRWDRFDCSIFLACKVFEQIWHVHSFWSSTTGYLKNYYRLIEFSNIMYSQMLK